MNNKVKLIIAFIICTAFSSVSFGQDLMSLEEAIELAMENNYDIQIASNNVVRSEKEHHIGNAGMLPDVTTSGTWQNSYGGGRGESAAGDTVLSNVKNQVRSIDLRLNQTLFDGFAMFRTYEKLGENVKLQGLKKQEEIENMTSQVMSAYYDVLETLEQLKLVEESMEYTKQQYEIVKAKEKAGKTSLIDVLNIKVSLAEDSSTVLDAQTLLQRSENYLSFLLGGIALDNYSFDQELNIVEVSSEILNQFDLEKNILVKQSETNVKITELDYEIYKSALYPQLFGFVGYGYNNSISILRNVPKQTTRELSIGVTANWTLFQGFKRKIQMQTSKIDRMNQEISGEKIKQNITMDFNNAKVSYATAIRRVQFDEKNLSLFKEQYKISKILFENGKLTSLELRGAQQQLFDYRNRVFLSKKEVKLQEIELLRLSGRLIEF